MLLDKVRSANKFQKTIIYYRDGGKCHYCGTEIDQENFQTDHKNPWSRGGKTQLNNLVASCYMCNGAKHIMAYDKFKASIRNNGLDWRRKRYFALRSSYIANK